MAVRFSNNAKSTLASDILVGATSLTVATGDGALFPALGAGDYFYVTLIDTADPPAIEVVKCTARATDVLTIVRAQDGSTASAYTAADKVELRIPSVVFEEIVDSVALNTAKTSNVSTSLSNTPAATTVALGSDGTGTTLPAAVASGNAGVLTGADKALLDAVPAGATILVDGDVGATVAAQAVTLNAQTGTAYTTVLADKGKLVTLSNAAAIALTIPTNAVAAYPVGTTIAFQQIGAGLVTMAGTGVTFNNRNGLISGGQHAVWSITKTLTDTWAVAGDLTAT